eukprot:6882802-Prymnesium_polylepis.1
MGFARATHELRLDCRRVGGGGAVGVRCTQLGVQIDEGQRLGGVHGDKFAQLDCHGPCATRARGVAVSRPMG